MELTTQGLGLEAIGQLNSDNFFASSNIFSTNKFTYYELVFNNIAPVINKDSSFGARLFINGRPASDNNYYWCVYGNDSGGNNAQSGQNDYLVLWASARSGPQKGTGLFGSMTLFNPLITSGPKPYQALIYAPQANSNNGCQVWIGGNYNGSSNGPAVGIQFNFYASGGGIQSGTIDVYGRNGATGLPKTWPS